MHSGSCIATVQHEESLCATSNSVLRGSSPSLGCLHWERYAWHAILHASILHLRICIANLIAEPALSQKRKMQKKLSAFLPTCVNSLRQGQIHFSGDFGDLGLTPRTNTTQVTFRERGQKEAWMEFRVTYSTMNTQQQTLAASPRFGVNSSSREMASGTLQNSDLSASTTCTVMADAGSLDVSASLALLTSNTATESELLVPSTCAPTSAIERAKVKNRTAQKRFRDRQKAGRVCPHALRACRPA